MAKLKFRGRLQYIPGPWGMNEPVKSARIKIIDKDLGGTDDTILKRNTNSLGKFSGTSKDWQDKRRVRYWSPMPLPGRWKTKTVPDPMDILMLEIDIKDGSHHFRGPFVFLGDNIEVPIVVPWGRGGIPDPVNVKVNGVACSSGEDLQKKARAAFEGGSSPVRIELRGPDALPFMPFAGKSLNQLKAMVEDILPGAKKMFYENPTGAEELLAIAVVILAIGAASAVTILATAVAFSLVLALVQGYSHIKLKVLNSDGQNPLPGIEFELRKA